MPVESDAVLREILGLETIAVVGCSGTPGKAAHDVPAYLREAGYEIYPVNPHTDEVFGVSAADTILDVEADIDIVCIFRPSEEVPAIVDEAVDRDDIDVVWTQRGIRNDEAAHHAEAAGVTMIQDRCMKVEHRRLAG